MTVQPFHFRLQKVSKKEQDLLEGLLHYTPDPKNPEQLHENLRKVLQKHFGPQVRYVLSHAETGTLQQFYNDLPDHCVVAALSLAPLKEKIFVQLDPVLLFRAIDKLLGGEGEAPKEFRPLTDSEQGVLEFLILELLAQWHQSAGRRETLHFRLDKIAGHAREIKQWVSDRSPTCLLTLQVTLWQQAGFLKICLPHPMVTKGLLEATKGAPLLLTRREIARNLPVVGTMEVPLWGALGEAEISVDDLQQLEVGDVVLFDTTRLKTSSGGIFGEVVLKVGSGESGGVVARWDGFEKGGQCYVAAVMTGNAGDPYGEKSRTR